MQGRPLRCQHGRRWSQSARARWCCISWRSGGRLAVPGPKSDRAAPSWRGWVAQKSAAHHAMVPMQLNKHCHSRDLAERWRLAYCIILWPLYSQSYRHGNNSCHLGLARPTARNIAPKELPSSSGHSDAPPAYLAPVDGVQIPLKAPPRRISFDRFGRTLAVILGRRGAV